MTNIIRWIIIAPLSAAGAFLLLGLLGLMVDTVADRSEQHDRCLKQATNGYEIRRCR